MDDNMRLALRAWLSGREAIYALVREWPPGCKVTSRDDAPLMIPAPGVTGIVVSYFEDGTLGVEAPMAATKTSPITGSTMEAGEIMLAQCAPASLVLLEESEITRDNIAGLLDGESI